MKNAEKVSEPTAVQQRSFLIGPNLQVAQNALAQIRADYRFGKPIDFPASGGSDLSFQGHQRQEAFSLREFDQQINIALPVGFARGHRATFDDFGDIVFAADYDELVGIKGPCRHRYSYQTTL